MRFIAIISYEIGTSALDDAHTRANLPATLQAFEAFVARRNSALAGSALDEHTDGSRILDVAVDSVTVLDPTQSDAQRCSALCATAGKIVLENMPPLLAISLVPTFRRDDAGRDFIGAMYAGKAEDKLTVTIRSAVAIASLLQRLTAGLPGVLSSMVQFATQAVQASTAPEPRKTPPDASAG